MLPLTLTPHPRPSQDGPIANTIQQLTHTITPTILYLKDITANNFMPYLIQMIPFDRYQYIPHLGILLKHIQSLTDDPTAIIFFPDIKSAYNFFHQLLFLLPNDPVFTNKLLLVLLGYLLQYLSFSTSANFTSK